MRKRRRLADKLTIMVCAVLVAVSAFFYAPMEVSAEVSGTSGSWNRDLFYARGTDAVTFDFSPYLNSGDGYYIVEFDVNSNWFCDNYVFWWRHLTTYFKVSGFEYSAYDFGPEWVEGVGQTMRYTYTPHMKIMVDSSNPVMTVSYEGVPDAEYEMTDVIYTLSYNVFNVSSVKISSSDTNDYQNGYNAGYSAGEQAGYGNGYSNGFADGEASVDTNDIYNQGFEAGKDSVDTQAYYDAGYQAGYQVAYQDGYDSGYDEGYQSAMDRIDGWGADTSDYPLKMSSFSSASQEITATVFTSVPSISYEREVLFDLNFDINPNHTYKYVVKARGVGTGLYDALFSDYDLNLSIGSNTFDISRSGFERAFYIPGYNMDSLTCLEMYVYDGVYYGGVSEEDGFLKHIGHVSAEIYDFFIDVYDMGPSGDTQNHIANQTDKLTNGFNDSKGNSVNSDFSSGLNDFETAEDSLFATATTGLKDFTFFDIQSVPAMVTGMSFVGSIMSGWFTQAGGASGVGIVLSILFSIMLVAMVLGLYRWYQSKGGKD